MKKILAFIICAVIVCVATIGVYAEGGSPDVVEPNDVVEENVPPTEEDGLGSDSSGEEVVPEEPADEEIPEEKPEDIPEETPEETPTEPTPEETVPEVIPEPTPEETPEEIPEEIPEETPEPTPEETPEEIPEETPEVTPEETPEEIPEPTPEETVPVVPDETLPDVTNEATLTGPEQIVEYIKTYFEEISVIVSVILYGFYQARKHKLLNKSVGTLNNNAVTIAENSDRSMQAALENVTATSAIVKEYKDEMRQMLAEIRKNNVEKKKLEDTLDEVHKHLEQSKLANVEFANELAELLVLANIPNAKKDELYARHRAAVDAIAVKEEVTVTEVNPDDNGETE